MEVILAKSAGFCFGVKRAMDKVEEQIQLNNGKPIYTFGPIIHNEQVVLELKNRGVNVVDSLEELDIVEKGVMIIRSHGVSKSVNDMLENKGFTVIDATCPFVKRIHNIVKSESEAGNRIIIIGNSVHPEVEGIKGWCVNEPFVFETPEDVEKNNLSFDEKYTIVSQTTFNHIKFQYIVEKITKMGYDVNVVNTICNATSERQNESREVARKVDTMIVIGDTHSSNSKKLFEICGEECEDTHFIQTLDDLNLEDTKSVRLVGITAGASTPNYIIEEVQKYVRDDF